MDRATRSNQAQNAALKLRRLEATIERDANADLTDKAVAEAARLEQEENRLAEQFAQVSARYRTQTKVPFTAMVDAMAAYPKRKVVEQESESLPLSAQTLPQEVGDGKITQRTAADLAYQELAAKVRGSNNLSNSQPIAENVSKNAPVSKVDMQQFVQNRDQDLMIILQEISDDES
jgi:hypothetical protein